MSPSYSTQPLKQGGSQLSHCTVSGRKGQRGQGTAYPVARGKAVEGQGRTVHSLFSTGRAAPTTGRATEQPRQLVLRDMAFSSFFLLTFIIAGENMSMHTP